MFADCSRSLCCVTRDDSCGNTLEHTRHVTFGVHTPSTVSPRWLRRLSAFLLSHVQPNRGGDADRYFPLWFGLITDETTVMYEFLSRGAIVSDDPRAVIWHRGKYAELLTRHHDDVKRVLPNGLRGLRSLAPYLMERIADASTLRVA